MKPVAIAVLLTGIYSICCASTPVEREQVKAFLDSRINWGEGRADKKPDANDFKKLGKAALPTLAEFLPDYDLGIYAALLMLEFDPQNSAPFLFRSKPKTDRNAQCQAFIFYIHQLRNKRPFTYAREMHNAAVRCLKADSDSEIAELALLAIGLTGSKKDFALLQKYYENDEEIENWRWKIRSAAEASLAKLGSEKHLDCIAQQLQLPVPAKLTFEWSWRLSETMRKAAFTCNNRFVPLLAVHLDTPTLESNSDEIWPEPSREAASALAILVNGVSPDKHFASVDEWKKWRANSLKH